MTHCHNALCPLSADVTVPCENPKLFTCAACYTAQYCSQQCQRSDWRSHRTECKQLQGVRAILNPCTAKEDAHRLASVDIVDAGLSLGRVAVAARSFDACEVIFAEDPLIVWPTGDMEGMLMAYARATETIRARVLNMFHPPADSAAAQRRTHLSAICHDLLQRVQILQQTGVRNASNLPSNSTLIKRLLLVCDLNAHEIIGLQRTEPTSDTQEVNTSSSGVHQEDTEYTGLFELAAILESGCLGNTHYSTTTGRIQYTASRPIAAGERLTCSYIGPTLDQPLLERRERLLRSKDFVCCCSRCLAPDACRPLACPADRCNGIVLRTTQLTDPRALSCEDLGTWECTLCAGVFSDDDMHERIACECAQIADFERHEASSFSTLATKGSLAGQRRAAAQLPPHHYLHARYHKHLASLYASKANDERLAESMQAQVSRSKHSSTEVSASATMLLESSLSTLHLLRWYENVEAVFLGRVGMPCTWLPASTAADVDIASCQPSEHRAGWRDRFAQVVAEWEDSQPPSFIEFADPFYAGVNLYAANMKEQARMVFKRYESVIMPFLAPDDPDRAFVQAAIAQCT